MSNQVHRVGMIRNAKIRTSKNGSRFLQGEIHLQNTSSSIAFKMWNYQEKDPIKNGAYEVYGHLDKFNGKDQMIASKVQARDDIHIQDFMPKAPFDFKVEEVQEEFVSRINMISSPEIRTWVIACIIACKHPWLTWRERFKESSEFLRNNMNSGSPVSMTVSMLKETPFNKAWAATRNHHAYNHGLIIHTNEVIRVALSMYLAIGHGYTLNEDIFGSMQGQQDVVLAGSILHDIGKVYENNVQNSSYEKTNLGILYTNDLDITSTFVSNIFNMISDSNTSDNVHHMYMHVMKCIHGHHGQYGNQLPNTIPSLCVSYADGSAAHLAWVRDEILKGDPKPYVKGSNNISFKEKI